ncbi:MAG: response regulator [bacterium]
MYKLVIVDDEQYVLRGLKNCIKWNDYDIEIAGEARNGKEALEIIKEKEPELVITDIYMSDVNGLELIEKVHETLPYTKTIILSGYEDFEYAQTAIRERAFDYLLKPVEMNKMIEIIQKAKNQIDEELQKIKNQEKLEKQLKESLPVLREKYLRYVLTDIFTLPEVKQEYQFLNINLKSENFVVMMIKIEELQEDCDARKQMQLINIKNIIYETINQYLSGEVIEEYSRVFIAIINYENETIEEIKKIAQTIKKSLNKIYNISLEVGIGSQYKDYNNISKSYREAEEALEYKFFSGDNIVYYGDIAVSKKDSVLVYPFNIEKKILTALKIGDLTRVDKYLEKFINSFTEKQNIAPEKVKRNCLQLVYSIYKKIIEWDISFQVKHKIDHSVEAGIREADSIVLLKENLNNLMKMIAENIKVQKETQNEEDIQKACRYIEKNYDRELSLKDIASSIPLTKNYFANLFKEKTGRTAMSYLKEVRIRKAKEMLSNSDLKIYEIAEKVGYNNSNYFSKVFKEDTGSSPSDYRKNN